MDSCCEVRPPPLMVVRYRVPQHETLMSRGTESGYANQTWRLPTRTRHEAPPAVELPHVESPAHGRTPHCDDGNAKEHVRRIARAHSELRDVLWASL